MHDRKPNTKSNSKNENEARSALAINNYNQEASYGYYNYPSPTCVGDLTDHQSDSET